MQFYAIEPFGLHAQDRLFAQLSGAVLAAGGAKNVNLSDLLQFDEDRLTLPDDVAAEEQRMMLMLMKRAG